MACHVTDLRGVIDRCLARAWLIPEDRIDVGHLDGEVWQPGYVSGSVEMEKVVVGCSASRFRVVDTDFVWKNVNVVIVYAQSEATGGTASVLLQPRLKTGAGI